MAKDDQEMEAKFAIRDLAKIEQRLRELGAELAFPRVLETNLRFDTPDGALARARQVLRLRQDAGAVMTFKGPARAGESVSVRQEIEFQVSDFGAAQRLLEAQTKQPGMRAAIATHDVIDAIPYTIEAIATRRVSQEGQQGMKAFLEKKKAPWA